MEGDLAAVGDQRFPRDYHIRKRRDFLRTYEQGRRAHGRLAVIFCLPRQDGGLWRIGLTVTKKTAGAVGRNRLRRRVREYFRRRHGLIPNGWDLVINLKSAACTAKPAEFDRDLTQILHKLGFAASAPPEGPAAQNNA